MPGGKAMGNDIRNRERLRGISSFLGSSREDEA